MRGANQNAKVLRGRPVMQARWPAPKHTVVFLRHPLTRTASAWNHLLNQHEDPGYHGLVEMGFLRGMSFAEFVQHLMTFHPGDVHDQHLRPQIYQCYDVVADCENAQVVRVDNLDEEWPELVQSSGLTCTSEIPHFNDFVTARRLEEYEHNYLIATPLIQFYSADYRAWTNRSCSV